MTVSPPRFVFENEKDRWGALYAYLTELAETLNRAGASETVTTQKQAAVSPAETFSSVKNLIIRSAEIVQAYSDIIRENLSGVYASKAAFGTYTEKTDLAITKHSTDIEEQFSKIAQVSSDVYDIEETLKITNAYIRRGKVGEDASGNPIYGIEVGETADGVFTRFARFTSSELSFYDSNGTKVAYISDSKLFITTASVNGNLTVGGYTVDTRDGLLFKWTGGAGR